jgi:hypothetical protein
MAALDSSVQRVINEIMDPATRASVQKLVEWMVAQLATKADS